MFNQFYEEFKKDIDKLGQDTFAKLQTKFDEMWKLAIGELDKTKIQKQEEVKQLETQLLAKKQEIDVLTAEILRFKDAEKKLQDNCAELKVKTDKMADIYLGEKGKVEELAKREADIAEKEKAQKEMSLELSVRESQVSEKEQSLKRILIKLNQ